jgi:photosystem II stability/assembly factor-like uncharacterized protein
MMTSVTLTACGTAAPHLAARTRPAAQPRPLARAASPAVSQSHPNTPSTRPAVLYPVSATFISPATGWLLAGRCSRPGECPAVVRMTTDGGRRWTAVPAPPAPVLVASPGPGVNGITQIRFADAANGWAFGPDLWVTHDGGASWQQLSTHGLSVTSLEAADGRAVAVFASETAFSVYTSTAGSDTWQPVPGASGPASVSDEFFGPNPQVAIDGSRAYVSSGAEYGNDPGILMSGPADGSAAWQRLPIPCLDETAVDMPVAVTPSEVVLGCGGSAASGQSPKDVYLSADGGRSWQGGTQARDAPGELPMPGFLDDIAITPAGTIVASGDREAYFSWDNGTTWQTPAALAPAIYLGGEAGQVVIGMTTDDQGFALPGYPEIGVANGSSWIWMTYNAGHSWTQVPLS